MDKSPDKTGWPTGIVPSRRKIRRVTQQHRHHDKADRLGNIDGRQSAEFAEGNRVGVRIVDRDENVFPVAFWGKSKMLFTRLIEYRALPQMTVFYPEQYWWIAVRILDSATTSAAS